MLDIDKSETSINLASSPLWIEKYRTHCCEHKLATYQINLLRSKLSADSKYKS